MNPKKIIAGLLSIIQNKIFFKKRSDKYKGNILYYDNYHYREAPLPRPFSNVSLSEVFSWFFQDSYFLPHNPHVNEIARQCRENTSYIGNMPRSLEWSSEREAGHAIYSFVRLMNPKNVIEIGIFNGATSISIAQGLKDNNQDSLLHCIDIEDDSVALTKKHVIEAGLDNYVKFYHGDSNNQSIVNELPESEIIFIDGDHSYEGALRDFNTYKKLLSINGILIFHDTIKIMALRKLISEISESNQWHIFTFATSDGDGITLLKYSAEMFK